MTRWALSLYFLCRPSIFSMVCLQSTGEETLNSRTYTNIAINANAGPCIAHCTAGSSSRISVWDKMDTLVHQHCRITPP